MCVVCPLGRMRHISCSSGSSGSSCAWLLEPGILLARWNRASHYLTWWFTRVTCDISLFLGRDPFPDCFQPCFWFSLAENVHVQCCCCRLCWFAGQFLTPLCSSGCWVSNCSISQFTFQPALIWTVGIPSPTVKYCLHLPKAKAVPFSWLFWVYFHSRENS